MRIAIDGGRGAEYQRLDAGPLHRRAQRQQAVQVVVVVGERLRHRFADRLQRGEMDRAADLVLGEQPVQQGAVAHVTLDESRRLAGNGGDPVDHRTVAVGQIVQPDHVVAGREQCNPGMRSDIAGGTGQQQSVWHRELYRLNMRTAGPSHRRQGRYGNPAGDPAPAAASWPLRACQAVYAACSRQPDSRSRMPRYCATVAGSAPASKCSAP